MSNPFDDSSLIPNYKEFIENQLSRLKVGESIQLDLGGKRIDDARMNASKASANMGCKFKTKLSPNKLELWVLRVL
ncbi:hypothetical protein MAELSTROM_60 [Pseudoalteromonas phage Maelstrom]|uniref:hypothetical protein n=1 Tax=Pseudoalteromonas phage Maelstrom TaxID=2065202 RepID=UPI000CA3AFB0|nr:hypothetical protein PP584_gp60 [Pseudoalteromonas phage Maelstrom]AUG84979.1 hypothetical protein MAELSTROM_60 [Pseudoalteromonas phage Maelstrom]